LRLREQKQQQQQQQEQQHQQRQVRLQKDVYDILCDIRSMFRQNVRFLKWDRQIKQAMYSKTKQKQNCFQDLYGF